MTIRDILAVVGVFFFVITPGFVGYMAGDVAQMAAKSFDLPSFSYWFFVLFQAILIAGYSAGVLWGRTL